MDGTAVRTWRTAGKGAESLPGGLRGGGVWKEEPVRKGFRKGWRMHCCVCCLEDLSADIVSL